MSDDTIEVGQRRRWKPPGTPGVFDVLKIRGDQCHLRQGISEGWCMIDAILAISTRIDTPAAVKVGDIVKDPALLWEGMRVQWAGCAFPGEWEIGPGMIQWTRETVQAVGVRVLALPGPAKAEAPAMFVGVDYAAQKPTPSPPDPPRCKPGCAPGAPCMTEGVCGYWREPPHSRVPGLRGGGSDVSPDLPAARASTYVPRHEGLAGWATRGWR
jgi:hypothetical protein